MVLCLHHPSSCSLTVVSSLQVWGLKGFSSNLISFAVLLFVCFGRSVSVRHSSWCTSSVLALALASKLGSCGLFLNSFGEHSLISSWVWPIIHDSWDQVASIVALFTSCDPFLLIFEGHLLISCQMMNNRAQFCHLSQFWATSSLFQNTGAVPVHVRALNHNWDWAPLLYNPCATNHGET